MLQEKTTEKLTAMRLHGMVEFLRRWVEAPAQQRLSPLEFAGMLADAEWLHRENKRLSTRLRTARLRHSDASLEGVDYAIPRQLEKQLVLQLQTSVWIQQNQNLVITGPTGVGKSYIACAFGQKACRDGFSVLYRRASRLFEELAQARADGTLPTVLRRIAKTRLLIIDDFGLEVLSPADRKALLEVIEDRYALGSTLITSQLPIESWHPVIGDATLADAILDRLLHNAHRLKLDGPSVRKVKGSLTSS